MSKRPLSEFKAALILVGGKLDEFYAPQQAHSNVGYIDHDGTKADAIKSVCEAYGIVGSVVDWDRRAIAIASVCFEVFDLDR